MTRGINKVILVVTTSLTQGEHKPGMRYTLPRI